MNAEGFWKLFVETGDVLFYLLYKEEKMEKTEEKTA